MKYEDYIQLQIGGEGHLNKPIRYAKGEQRAIDWFMIHSFSDLKYDQSSRRFCKLLDVGCGEGWGINYFNQLGFENVVGVDLHPEKLEWAYLKSRTSEFIHGDFLERDWMKNEKFSLFWCSHSLEHFLDVGKVLDKIESISYIGIGEGVARLWAVLPYPDLNPAPAHTASKQLGLNIEDEGKTVIKFFEDRGFKLVRHKFDDYREPEIWLDLVKENGNESN